MTYNIGDVVRHRSNLQKSIAIIIHIEELTAPLRGKIYILHIMKNEGVNDLYPEGDILFMTHERMVDFCTILA
jgi:radical SAM superfamily enzyme